MFLLQTCSQVYCNYILVCFESPLVRFLNYFRIFLNTIFFLLVSSTTSTACMLPAPYIFNSFLFYYVRLTKISGWPEGMIDTNLITPTFTALITMMYPLQFSNKTSPSSKTSQVATGKPSKELEFVDDPFRDYRYEDPFNISFEEEESLEKSTKSEVIDAFNNPKSDNGNSVDAFNTPQKNSVDNWDDGDINKNKKEFEMDKFDPFGLDGRQSAPLHSNDLFMNNSGRASAPILSKVLTEDQQLALAASESLRSEKERQQRLLQEEAELKLAISLSKFSS